jgi:hypothetical protein
MRPDVRRCFPPRETPLVPDEALWKYDQDFSLSPTTFFNMKL